MLMIDTVLSVVQNVQRTFLELAVHAAALFVVAEATQCSTVVSFIVLLSVS